MLLTKKEIILPESNMETVYFEKIGNNLLLVSMINQKEKPKLPSYWRLTESSNIPPLEIGIDYGNGRIIDITFFVDVLSIKKGKDNIRSVFKRSILVDTAIFTKEFDFYDVKKPYYVSICKDKLICSFCKNPGIVTAFKESRTEIHLDSDNRIVGFAVCDLSEEEKKLMEITGA